MADFDSQDIALLIAAVQHYKQYSQRQRQQRSQEGWDTTEQWVRIRSLDSIEETLFEWLEHSSDPASTNKLL